MYNLNVNVSTAGTAVNNLLAVESACTTPRTPEILNSLIAMTNPLDNYSFNGTTSKIANGGTTKTNSGYLQNISNDSNSSSSNQETYSSNTSPPSVQHTCSQLIKAGLKLSIESKRKYSVEPEDLLDLDANTKKVKKKELEDDDDDGDRSQSPTQGLTPEDEERRRRRRERNKIAATKCRLKKREKTVNLVHESEILETQNIDLKTQIQELESQRRRLVDMLTLHTPSCIKQTTNATSDHYHVNPNQDDNYIIPDEDASCYSTEDALPSVTTLTEHSVFDDTFSTNQDIEFCSRTTNTVPTILIDGESYSPPTQLTDLDNTYNYNSQQPCHNYNVTTNGTVQNYNSPTMDNGCMA